MIPSNASGYALRAKRYSLVATAEHGDSGDRGSGAMGTVVTSGQHSPREVLQEPRRPRPLDALPGDTPPRSSTGDSADHGSNQGQ